MQFIKTYKSCMLIIIIACFAFCLVSCSNNSTEKIDAFTDPDNAKLLSEYVAGQRSDIDNTYRNETVGIQFVIPDNFTVKPVRNPDNELFVEDEDEKLIVSITHAASTEKDDLNGFMTKVFNQYQSQNKPYMEYQLSDLMLTGQNRPIIIAVHNENNLQSVTVQAGYEKNGHFLMVSATGPYTESAVGLLSLIQPIESQSE